MSESQGFLQGPEACGRPDEVPYRDDQDRGEAARGSGEPFSSVDPRWGGYPRMGKTAHPGPVDVRTLPVNHLSTLGLADSGLEPVPQFPKTVRRLLHHQKTDPSTTPRTATADGITYCARRRLPLPDTKPAGRAGKTTKSAATSSPTSTLHIGEG